MVLKYWRIHTIYGQVDYFISQEFTIYGEVDYFISQEFALLVAELIIY